MPLNDRARVVLFWITIVLMLAVAVLAAVTILRACGGLPTQSEPPLTISPPEATLCPGDQQRFAVAGDLEVEWEATGGTITADGVFTAGDDVGDYTVSATREESGRAAGAVVHIVPCTPTPTATPLPTLSPTDTPSPEPTAEPTASSPGDSDPEGDVGDYETGELVESPPSGVDIAGASLDAELGLALEPDALPDELADWREEGEILFWMSLHDAIPEPPSIYMNWLFVVDADGDTETGRPMGSRRINPDLGDEIALGVSYNPATEAYEPYSLVWDSDDGAWAAGPEVRYTFGESRTVVGLAVSLEALEGGLAQTEAGALDSEEARGRAAAETYLTDETRVIDFYPELPE